MYGVTVSDSVAISARIVMRLGHTISTVSFGNLFCEAMLGVYLLATVRHGCSPVFQMLLYQSDLQIDMSDALVDKLVFCQPKIVVHISSSL